MIATTDVAGVSTQLAVLTYLFNPFRLRGRIVWAAREPIMVFGPTTVSGSFFCGHSAFQARPARRTLSPPPGVGCLGLVVCKAANHPVPIPSSCCLASVMCSSCSCPLLLTSWTPAAIGHRGSQTFKSGGKAALFKRILDFRHSVFVVTLGRPSRHRSILRSS